MAKFGLKFTLLILLVVAMNSPLCAQNNWANGKVYLDANENGKFDEGERGIEGVKVSME